MKKITVAAACGLFCLFGPLGSIAAPGSSAPSNPSSNPSAGDSGSANVGAPVAGAAPLPRSAYLPKLQEFYARGKALYDESKSDKISDKEVNSRFSRFIEWVNEAGNWINVNIGPAATAKFTTWHMEAGDVHKLSGVHSAQENNKFRTISTVLPQILDNLQFLMTPAAVEYVNKDKNSSN